MAHYLIDEPHNSASWGAGVPYETLEQMAQYSKSSGPDLPTVIRTRVSWLAQAPFRGPTSTRAGPSPPANRGTSPHFRDDRGRRREPSGLVLLFSLNISDGGTRWCRGCYPRDQAEVGAP